MSVSNRGTPGLLVRLASRILGPDQKMHPAGKVPEFFDQRIWVYLLGSMTVGFLCGFTSGLLIHRWDEWPHPTFGLFVVPAVAFGFLALRPSRAVLAGGVTLLSTTLGDLLGMWYGQAGLGIREYVGWGLLALVLGPVLGVLGHTVRASWRIIRGIATGVVAAMILLPLHYAFLDDPYYSEFMPPAGVVFDLAAVAALLALCRGIPARLIAVGTAWILVCKLELLHASMMLVHILVWWSKGSW